MPKASGNVKVAEAQRNGPTREKRLEQENRDLKAQLLSIRKQVDRLFDFTDRPLQVNESENVEVYTIDLKETMAGFLAWLAKRSGTTPQEYARKIVVQALESTLEQLTPEEAKALLNEADLARDWKMLDNDPMVTTVEG